MEIQQMLRETVPHGNAMLPFMIHEVTPDCGKTERVAWHWHEEVEFLLLTKGWAQMAVGESVYAMQAGDVVWIPSNRLHAMQAQTGETVSFLAFDLALPFLYSYADDSLQQQYFLPLHREQIVFETYYAAEGSSALAERLLALHGIFDAKETGYELRIKAGLYEIFAWMFSHALVAGKDRPGDRRAEQTRQIMRYLQAHYERTVSMEELSAQFHLSVGHLCRLFKDVTGQTVVDYLNAYRIRVSARLLTESSLDIGEIAGRAGFNNISYFNRKFRQYMHETPSEFRRKQANGAFPESDF